MWNVAFLTVGVPAVHASHNDGPSVSVALGLPLPLAFSLVLATVDLACQIEGLLWGLGAALQFGLRAGVLRFTVGAGTRRLRERFSTRGPTTS